MVKKILIGFGIIVAALTILIVLTVWMVSSANHPKGNKEEILASTQKPLKKALIVYQPGISDDTSRMARQIANGLNNGGYEVTLNYPGDHLSADISAYSLVVFGSPTYGGKPLSVVTDFMSGIKNFASSKIVLYTTGASPESPELDVFEKSLGNAKLYKKIKFRISSKEENDKAAYELGKELSKE